MLTHEPKRTDYSVLFVCTANVFRSPLAATLLRKIVQKTNGDDENWLIESVGTWVVPGQPGDDEVRKLLNGVGIEFNDHRSQEVSEELLRKFCLILTMENGHKESLIVEFPEFKGRIFMLSEMAGAQVSIKDPVGGDKEDFEDVMSEINRWLKQGEARIRELASSNSSID